MAAALFYVPTSSAQGCNFFTSFPHFLFAIWFSCYFEEVIFERVSLCIAGCLSLPSAGTTGVVGLFSGVSQYFTVDCVSLIPSGGQHLFMHVSSLDSLPIFSFLTESFCS
jgi:hypothetical protein